MLVCESTTNDCPLNANKTDAEIEKIITALASKISKVEKPR